MKANGLIILFFLFWTSGFSQTITLDLTALGNNSFKVTAPGIDTTESNNGIKSYTISGSGEVLIELDVSTQTSAFIKLDVDGVGKMTNPQWKDADSSQTGSYDTLPSSFYSLEVSGTTLRLYGSRKACNYFYLDVYPIGVVQVDSTSNSIPVDYLFPGDYQIDYGTEGGQLFFEVTSASLMGSNVYFRENQSAPKLPLNPAYHYIKSNTGIYFYGVGIDFDMTTPEDHDLYVNGVKSAKEKINSGQSSTLKLLPGYISGDFKETVGGSLVSNIKLKIDNQLDAIGNTLEWKDPVGSQTGGNWVTLDLDNYHRTRRGTSVIIVPGPNPPVIDYDQWAILQKELNGGWHRTDNKVLRFKFEERYNISTNLVYQIWDKQHTDVTPSGAAFDISRSYGINWCEVDLTNASLTNGEYYTLEVSGSKGDTWFLRFLFQ